jgi:hypothetical protein
VYSLGSVNQVAVGDGCSIEDDCVVWLQCAQGRKELLEREVLSRIVRGEKREKRSERRDKKRKKRGKRKEKKRKE